MTFLSENFWATATLVLTIVTTLTGLLNGWLHPNRTWKQIIAWFVSIAMTVGLYFAKVITVAEPVWLTLSATGVVVGLAANGFYEIPVIKNFVKKIFNY